MNERIFLNSIIGLFVGISLLFSLTFFKGNASEKDYKFFGQGVKFSQQEDYQNAYYNFGKINKFSKLYPLAIYRQALCAKELNDTKTAIKKYKKFLSTSSDINFRPAALWELAEIYRKNDKIHASKKIYQRIIKKNPDSDFAIAAKYRMAEYTKDIKLRKKYMAQYLEEAPIGRFSKICAEKFETYNLDENEKYILANSYFTHKEYEKALKILKNTKETKNLFLSAKCYFALSDKENAKKYFISYLKNTSEDGEDINEAITSYIKASGQTKAQALNYLAQNIQNKYAKAGILFNIAQISSRKNALNLYTQVLNLTPNGYYAPESLAEIFWCHYKDKNYNKALSVANNHMQNFPDKNSSAKIAYFTGKIHLIKNNKRNAERYFSYVLTNYPNGYYAFRANEMLGKRKKTFSTQPFRKLPPEENITINTNSYFLDVLCEFEDFKTIETLKLKDEFFKSYVAYKKGSVQYSILLAKNALDELGGNYRKNPNWAKLAYPIYYQYDINESGEKFSINPHFIISLIKEESHFDKNAVSSAGASGLMQIMPTTASFMEDRTVSAKDLQNTEYNIYIGTKYIDSIIEGLGNEMFAVASYNAGYGNVRKWQKQIFDGDLDNFVEDIPFLETKMYVKKVFASFWNYTRLY